MVLLTRLNGSKFFLNAELIKTLESSPDTTLTLISGEKLVVAEPPAEVVDAVIAYRREVSGAVELKLPAEDSDIDI